MIETSAMCKVIIRDVMPAIKNFKLSISGYEWKEVINGK
jgi:hypothetical protein